VIISGNFPFLFNVFSYWSFDYDIDIEMLPTLFRLWFILISFSLEFILEIVFLSSSQKKLFKCLNVWTKVKRFCIFWFPWLNLSLLLIDDSFQFLMPLLSFRKKKDLERLLPFCKFSFWAPPRLVISIFAIESEDRKR